MGSLQDQLMKAGLATPEQLRKARAEQRRERGGKRGRPAGSRTSAAGGRSGPRPPSTAAGDAGHRAEGNEHPAGRDGRSRRDASRPSSVARSRGRGNRRGASAGGPPHRDAEPRTGAGGVRSPGPDPSVQALNLRIRALLDAHALNDKAAESPFNFMRENFVRRVYATDEQRRGLTSGVLAIVGFRRRHHIVPAAVADEIHALRPIVFIHHTDPEAPKGGGEAAGDDDPYRDFPVPDDLHW